MTRLPGILRNAQSCKNLLFLMVCFGASFTTWSQKTMINVYSGYVFDDRFEYHGDSYTYYDGTVKGSWQWGAGLEFRLRETQSVELYYLRQDTYAPTSYQAGVAYVSSKDNFPVDINYIMLGGNRRLASRSGKVEGFFGPGIGAAIINLQSPAKDRTQSETRFAWGLKLGMDIALSPVVKLRLQGSMTSPVQAAGGGLYFGTGGAGAGISLHSTLYQWGLGGGLVFVPQRRSPPPPPQPTPATTP